MKVRLITFCAMIFMAADFSFAKSKFIDVPGKNEVTLIGRIHFSTDMDRQFLFDTSNVPEDKRDYPDVCVLPFFPGKPSGLTRKVQKLSDTVGFDEQAWSTNGNYFFVQYKLTKERTLYLSYVTLFIGGSYLLPVALPLKLKVTVPEDEKFLYIGDFYYTAKGFAFVVDCSVKDEFDSAQKALDEVTKHEYRLSRARLSEATYEDFENVNFTYEVSVTNFSKWYTLLNKRGITVKNKE